MKTQHDAQLKKQNASLTGINDKNDKKHGQGRLTYKDGETIDGTWLNDRINGIAVVTKGKQKDQVIYKDDMKIQTNNSGVSAGDKFYVFVSFFLMLAFYAAIPLGILINE